jgi:hypothetical protein
MHETKLYRLATGKSIPSFSDDTVGTQYFQQTGGADTGLDPVAFASFCRKTGIYDDAGTYYKIKAFGYVSNLNELGYAVYLYGAAAMCFALPDGAPRRFEQHLPWDDTSEDANPSNGHYVPIFGKNHRGMWIASTWGDLQGISDEFMQKYSFDASQGGLVYFSRDYLLATGKSPEAINEAQLDADLTAITNLPDASAPPPVALVATPEPKPQPKPRKHGFIGV